MKIESKANLLGYEIEKQELYTTKIVGYILRSYDIINLPLIIYD